MLTSPVGVVARSTLPAASSTQLLSMPSAERTLVVRPASSKVAVLPVPLSGTPARSCSTVRTVFPKASLVKTCVPIGVVVDTSSPRLS